jgi:hypothetical protein
MSIGTSQQDAKWLYCNTLFTSIMRRELTLFSFDRSWTFDADCSAFGYSQSGLHLAFRSNNGHSSLNGVELLPHQVKAF